MRYVALGAAAVALVLGLVAGHGAPRCGGRAMGPDDWCTGALLGPSGAVSYGQKAALVDDVRHASLGLAAVFGGAGTAAVVVQGQRRRTRARLAARARSGLDGALRSRAAEVDLGAVVASGIGRDRQLVHLCERGVAVERDGAGTVVAWRDLVAVYEALGDAGVGATDAGGVPTPVARGRLVTATGALDLRAAPGDPVVSAVADAASAALDGALRPALVEVLDDGWSLPFGPLTVDTTALYRAGRRPVAVPWDRIEAVTRSVRVVQGAVSSRLLVTYRDLRRPGRRRRLAVDLLAVPNPRLLVDLAARLRSRGPLPRAA